MTSKSLNCKPLLLRPAGKDYLWGGNRLRQEYGKDLGFEPLAETWECSTHPDGPSIVVDSIYAGKGLDEVLQMHPEWLGSRHCLGTGTGEDNDDARSKAELPILIKFIDAAKDLSVQVHPDDDYAMVHENQLGKTEMWYVLDAEPGAKLVYGFAHDVTGEQVLKSLQTGDLVDYLQQIPVKKNDVFYVQPGTVHAIGGGVLLAEIQENSNVTYRLYDYDRVDKNGQKRPLHLKQALEVLNFKQADAPRQQMRLMRYQPGSASEILCRCRYFQVDRVLVTGEYHMRVESTSFQVLLILEGELDIVSGIWDAEEPCRMSVGKGDCVFLPADLGEVSLQGRGQLLQVFC